MNHFHVARIDDDRLGLAIDGDNRHAIEADRHAFEKRLQQLGGAAAAALLARRSRVLQAHARRHVEHQEQMPKFVFRDFAELVHLRRQCAQRDHTPA